ncbi:MAG: hypothetical protein PHS57_09120 [Alphaproteobacteria bacterium]|nr:hypothetical protein [Alphaproteobacteria bacterium]
MAQAGMKTVSGAPFVGVLFLYIAGFAALNNSPLGASPVLLAAYVGFALVLYALWQRMPLVALAALFFVVMPFVVFDTLAHRPDSFGYEYILGLGFGDMAARYKAALLGQESSWFLRGFFLFLTYPFANHAIPYEDGGFIPLNLFLLSLAAMTLRGLAADFAAHHGLSPRVSLIVQTALALFLLSPTTLCYSNGLLKDQASMLLVLLSALLFVRRHVVLGFFVLCLASGVRLYNVLIVFLYVMAVKPPGKTDYALLFAFFVAMIGLVRFDPVALFNMVFATGYVYVNPLPYKIENWAFPTGLATAQGLFFFWGWAMSVVQILAGSLRRKGLDRIAWSIALYGCVAVAVGYNNVVVLKGGLYDEWGLGGDDMMRKTMPILPLVCLQMAYALSCLFRRSGAALPHRSYEATKKIAQ